MKILKVVVLMIEYIWQSVPTVSTREPTSDEPDGDQDNNTRLVVLWITHKNNFVTKYTVYTLVLNVIPPCYKFYCV